ncbi:MAG: hypothetical protein KDJ52_11020 [Anaerolineae bacterium]|nr:hypothetical protein [Anaerolineae bacterium]
MEMNKAAIHSHPENVEHNWGIKSYILGVVLLIVVLELILDSALKTEASRLFLAGSVFMLAMFALHKNVFVAKQKKRNWSELVRRTNLECQVGNAFLSNPVYLEGFYQGRAVVLKNNSDKGIFSLPSTRIEMMLENLSNTSLRLRGPYPKNIKDATDGILTDVFSAAKLKQVGYNQRFFVGASHIHLTTKLLSVATIQNKLESLNEPVKIILEKGKIYFDHPGYVYDAEYLCFLLDLVNDIANAVERTANTRIMLSMAA